MLYHVFIGERNNFSQIVYRFYDDNDRLDSIKNYCQEIVMGIPEGVPVVVYRYEISEADCVTRKVIGDNIFCYGCYRESDVPISFESSILFYDALDYFNSVKDKRKK